MWYNPTLGIVTLPKQIEFNGKKYPASLFRNPALLVELEIYPVVVESVDTRYYVQGAETRTLINNEWHFTYAQTDRPLADVKVEAVRDAYAEMTDIIAQLEPFQEKVDKLSSYGLATLRQSIYDYKKDVYSAFAQRIADIQACATVNDVKTLEETGVSVPFPTDTWLEDIEDSIKTALSGISDTSDITDYATLADINPVEVLTTQQDFYRKAVTDMNDALALTDNFIYRESEYKKILPATITGNGQVNAFVFNLADLYADAKGWREDILQTTVARFNAIKAGADATAWQSALDDNVFATPTEDAIAQLIDAINNQGTFQTTSDTSEYGSVPVVNSVYQYRLEMI
ncbi:MAG: hypothetical protein VW683_15685, partial [Betaproteobacteria bacterium]